MGRNVVKSLLFSVALLACGTASAAQGDWLGRARIIIENYVTL